MFKKRRINYEEKHLEIAALAAFMPLSMAQDEKEALKDLLIAVRELPDQPVVVNFSGATWHISKEKITFI